MKKDKAFPFNLDVAWETDDEIIEKSNIYHFYRKLGFNNYDDFFKFSIQDIESYWREVLIDLNIQFAHRYKNILDLSEGKPFPHWCSGGKINIYETCLTKWINSGKGEKTALICEDEEGKVITYTYAELDKKASQFALSLINLGVKKGDVVALYMPMSPSIAIAFMAIVKIGAIILPLFSGYGPSAISTRLEDGNAKVVIFTDDTERRGKKINLYKNLTSALQGCQSVELAIGVDRTTGIQQSEFPRHIRFLDFWDLVNSPSEVYDATIVDPEDPVLLIYTSGTMGKPKGAVHSHVGFPIKAAHDLRYNFDLKEDDRLFWFSDMGWMMGPWEVFGALINGATMIFYEGAPDYPAIDRIWALVEKHKVTHLGISPNLVRAQKKFGDDPVQKHNLISLKLIGSTGSPWDIESWDWCFSTVLKSKKPIINYSGGTEISGGIICGNLLKDLKPCAFSGPVPGMDVDVVDDKGNPVRGAVGELIIRQPWMGMTMGFWNDKERYLESYWRFFDDVWRHGDFAAIDADGLYYILGRSDDTIKISGKRLGPAEVEGILNRHPRVKESAAIGVPNPEKDNEVVAFCVLNTPQNSSEGLRKELFKLLTSELGKALKPREILFTTALPKTRNAKVMRRLIRAIYLGEETGDTSSLEDPATLDAIRNSV